MKQANSKLRQKSYSPELLLEPWFDKFIDDGRTETGCMTILTQFCL